MLPNSSQFPNPNPPRPPRPPGPVKPIRIGINPVNPNMDTGPGDRLSKEDSRRRDLVTRLKDNSQKNGTGTTTPNKPPVSPPRTKGGTGTPPKPGSDKVTLPMRPGYKPERTTLPYNKNNSKKLGYGG